jgi:serine/threonine protein kinase
MSKQKPQIGDLIDHRFHLQTLLGKGGFGSVWLALDKHSNSSVAIKMLHTELLSSQWVLQRFTTEAEILRRLDHPRIARCLHVGTFNSMAYMCMELVQGRSMHEIMLEKSDPPTPYSHAEIARILDQLASALDYAHGQGIIHRDLKPKNIMISEKDGRIESKLLDFGIAKVLYDTAQDATTVGRLLGSLLYLSPEQALCEAISPRADIFSLATVIFELLTLRRTWAWDERNNPLEVSSNPIIKSETNNHLSILKRIVSGPRPRADRFCSGLSVPAAEVLVRAMSASPDERFESAGFFATAFHEAIGIQFTTPVNLVEEDSLTHVLLQDDSSDYSQPVVPSEHDDRDLVPTFVRPANPDFENSPTFLSAATPVHPDTYQSINPVPIRKIPQLVVLLFGLFIGVALTYYFIKPPLLPIQPDPQETVSENVPTQESKFTAKNRAVNAKVSSSKSTRVRVQKTEPKRISKTREHSAKKTKLAPQPRPTSALDKAWAAFRSSPDDLDKMEEFTSQFRTQIKKKISGPQKSSLLRRLQLAELQANLEEMGNCYRSFNEQVN